MTAPALDGMTRNEQIRAAALAIAVQWTLHEDTEGSLMEACDEFEHYIRMGVWPGAK